MNSEEMKSWQRKRSLTTITFALENLVLGMEYSLTFLTLWLYLNQLVPTDHPKFFYMAISIAFRISTIVFTPLIGTYVDRTRNVRSTFLLCNMLLVVGNIVYSLSFSPWLLLLGRFISGCGGSLKSVINSELVRSYPPDQLNQKLSIISCLCSCGFIVGPGLNLLFSSVDASVGEWRLTTVNFPGVFMAILALIMLVLSLTMVHDLSKEFDLKGKLETEERQSKINTSVKYEACDETTQLINTESRSGYGELHILKKLMSHADTALVIFTTSFVLFNMVTFDMWLPLLVIDVMHLSLTQLNFLVLGAGGFCFLVLAYFMWRPLTGHAMMSSLIASLLGLVAINGVFISAKTTTVSNDATRALLATIYMVGLGGAGVIPDVVFVNALGSMVGSKVQTFAESVRYSSYTLGSLLALLSSAYLFDYLLVSATVYIAANVVIAVCFCVRWKSFKNPKIIIDS